MDFFSGKEFSAAHILYMKKKTEGSEIKDTFQTTASVAIERMPLDLSMVQGSVLGGPVLTLKISTG
jgi:hypothetical protein